MKNSSSIKVILLILSSDLTPDTNRGETILQQIRSLMV